MKLNIQKDATSQILYLFIRDSSVTTGAGLTGLVFNSSGLTAYYVRPAGSATSISLVTQTATGAYSSGGFVAVDGTNMPGVYRFDVPNAVLATGVNSAVVMLKGATNMEPVVLEIQLVSFNPNDSVRLGLTALPNAAAGGSAGVPIVGTGTNNFKSDSSANVTFANTSIATVTTTTNLTNAATSGDLTATMKTSVETGVNNSLVALGLDHLVGAAVTGTDVVDNSIVAKMVSKSATADWDSFVNTTDALEAIRDKETDIETDTAEIGAAGAGLTAIDLPNQTMDIVGNITGNLSGSVGSVTGSVGSVTGHTPQTGDSFARLGAPAGASVSADIAALNDLSAAQVNAEVVDALNTDTYAEPGQGAPAATTTLANKIGYLYKFLRNRKTQTATTLSIYADDGTTVDQKATISDDATTYDHGEIATGP